MNKSFFEFSWPEPKNESPTTEDIMTEKKPSAANDFSSAAAELLCQ
jgi:hypothetical protein